MSKICVNKIGVHCAKCDYHWKAKLPMPIEISRFVSFIKGITAAGCPNCGANDNAVLLDQDQTIGKEDKRLLKLLKQEGDDDDGDTHKQDQ